MQPLHSHKIFRMRVLFNASNFNPTLNIRWNTSVMGVFFDPNPPHPHLVQGLINNQWERRGNINVHRTVILYL